MDNWEVLRFLISLSALCGWGSLKLAIGVSAGSNSIFIQSDVQCWKQPHVRPHAPKKQLENRNLPANEVQYYELELNSTSESLAVIPIRLIQPTSIEKSIKPINNLLITLIYVISWYRSDSSRIYQYYRAALGFKVSEEFPFSSRFPLQVSSSFFKSLQELWTLNFKIATRLFTIVK